MNRFARRVTVPSVVVLCLRLVAALMALVVGGAVLLAPRAAAASAVEATAHSAETLDGGWGAVSVEKALAELDAALALSDAAATSAGGYAFEQRMAFGDGSVTVMTGQYAPEGSMRYLEEFLPAEPSAGSVVPAVEFAWDAASSMFFFPRPRHRAAEAAYALLDADLESWLAQPLDRVPGESMGAWRGSPSATVAGLLRHLTVTQAQRGVDGRRMRLTGPSTAAGQDTTVEVLVNSTGVVEQATVTAAGLDLTVHLLYGQQELSLPTLGATVAWADYELALQSLSLAEDVHAVAERAAAQVKVPRKAPLRAHAVRAAAKAQVARAQAEGQRIAITSGRIKGGAVLKARNPFTGERVKAELLIVGSGTSARVQVRMAPRLVCTPQGLCARSSA